MGLKDNPKNLLIGSLFFLLLAIVGVVALSVSKDDSKENGGGPTAASTTPVDSQNFKLVEDKGEGHYIIRIREGTPQGKTGIHIENGQKLRVTANEATLSVIRDKNYLFNVEVDLDEHYGKSIKDSTFDKVITNNVGAGKLVLNLWPKFPKEHPSGYDYGVPYLEFDVYLY